MSCLTERKLLVDVVHRFTLMSCTSCKVRLLLLLLLLVLSPLLGVSVAAAGVDAAASAAAAVAAAAVFVVMAAVAIDSNDMYCWSCESRIRPIREGSFGPAP